MATGADTVTIPKDMGIKLGKDSGYKAVHLQIHYNNPEGVTDAKDSSVWTAYATTQPREKACAPPWTPKLRSRAEFV